MLCLQFTARLIFREDLSKFLFVSYSMSTEISDLNQKLINLYQGFNKIFFKSCFNRHHRAFHQTIENYKNDNNVEIMKANGQTILC